MKFVAITILALIAAANASPINISDNNIGDIIKIAFSGDLHVSNQVDVRIVNIILAFMNQELGVISVDGEDGIRAPNLPGMPELGDFEITPEMIERVKAFLASRQ